MPKRKEEAMITVYGLKNCDTCRKALKTLAEGGREAHLVDVRQSPLTHEDITRFLQAFGASLVNTRSTTWRQMTPVQREADPLLALQDNPTLMKRPVIVAGDAMYLGWGKDVQAALLGN